MYRRFQNERTVRAEFAMRMRQLQLYIKNLGDLVNTAAPIHVKQDSPVRNVLAKFVTMPGEKEEYTARGSVLMGGVKLHQSFAATGYSDKTRYFQDFGSRIYFMEKHEEKNS